MKYRTIAICLFMAIVSFISAAERPVIKTHAMAGVALQTMSDNGQWALAWGAEDDMLSPVLLNVATNERITLQSDEDLRKTGLMLAYDVTDDGNIIVGAYNGQPAYLNRTTGKWTTLPCSMETGAVRAVTPDGKFAVGSVNNGDIRGTDYMPERPAMWDLTTNTEVTPTDLPTTDPFGENLSNFFVRCINVSADGRYVLIQSLAYGCASYIYDRQAEDGMKWICLGYTTTDGKKYKKTVNNLVETQPTAISPNGEWVLCSARVNAFNDEFVCPARYNTKNQTFEIYDQTFEDMDILAGCIDNEGNVYAGTPAGTPLREFLVRSDGYWFSLRSLLKQRYGMDFELATGYDNTGTPMAVSTDGHTFICFSDPKSGDNYTLKMSEPLVDICADVNLLSNYVVTPAAGAAFSRLSQIRVTFDREVEVIGQQNAAKFGDWSSVSGNGIVVDPADAKTVVVTFRTRTLAEGQKYQFVIPAGVICVKDDHARTNSEITAAFTGRADAPVSVASVYPADGSVLAKLDNSSSPVQLLMDNEVKSTPSASAALYASDGSLLAPLSVVCYGKVVQLYPATTQYLFAGEDYTVVLAAGSLTDVCGSGANEEFTVRYSGSYERQVSTDNAVIFSCDFNNITSSLATWMLYDNDRNNPAEEMEGWEFDARNTPWNFSIRDNMESTDFCAASHSMYSPAGKSDDWMVTPQLYIPDDNAVLSFDAQSYSSSKRDVMKVVVWSSDKVYNIINEETFAKLSAEGKVVLEEALSPGKDDNALTDDWNTYTVSLAEYAGRNIYIAFVNQNLNQSAVFVDNVVVQRDMPYLLSLSNKHSVVNETEILIGGTLYANSKTGISVPKFSLLNADGEVVGTQTPDATTSYLHEGDKVEFRLGKLPLQVGEDNKFSVKIEYYREDKPGELVADEVKSSVKSLTFSPVKRVVLEEMTGTTCGNCPQGIIAIDRLKEIYGDRFIPISLHTYDGDAWGAGVYDYAGYLGLNAAPTGIVNRNSDILMPMMTDPETFDFTLTYYGYLWTDRVAEEMDTPTYLEVDAKVDVDKAFGKFSLPVTVRSALNAVNLNLNVFLVFMEDNLAGIQHNYFSSSSDPLLGDWGMGGRYGQPTVTGVVHNDVVRFAYGTSYSGTPGLLPQSMKAGEEYTTTLSGDLPGTYENLSNTKFAVILIDANTDKIVNACVVKTDGNSAIAPVIAPGGADGTAIYNLAGQKVGPDYKGIVIKNGRKQLVK